MALEHRRLIRPGKKSGQIFCVRQVLTLYKILPTHLGACKPTFYTIYTSHLRWNSTMRYCFYHTDLGHNAVFHNFAIQIALIQYSGRSKHAWAQVILVSGYPVLTAVNWSQHWCPICVHYQFSCAPKLAKSMRLNIVRDLVKINWSADSFQINHVTSMSWHMSPRYGHGILVSGYPVLTAVNWPYCQKWMSNLKDVNLPRHAWDTPSFLLIVSPTPPVQSVDVYARSITWQLNEKQLTIFHESRAWEPH